MTELAVPLSKSYPSTKGDFSQLTLREPTARDYISMPLPFKRVTHTDGGAENILVFPLLFKWASALGDIEEGILETFNRADCWALAQAIPGWIGADGSSADEKNSEG